MPLIAAALVLLLPGVAWLGLFWDPDRDLFEQLASVVGVSVSLTALIGLATFLLPLRLSTAGLVGIYLFLLPLACWGIRRWIHRLHKFRRYQYDHLNLSIQEQSADITRESPRIEPSQPAMRVIDEAAIPARGGKKRALRIALLSLLFLSILGLRFYQIRDLALPAWVDSVHHVLIVRLILENGGVPDTFGPYMPVPFYYHFGYHTVIAAYVALTRLEPHIGVLVIGQVLNAAVALAVYRLGKSLWSDWRRAGLSALLVGFVSQMPAYYVTWGRYTLLTGLVLLPLAVAIALDMGKKGPTLPRFAELCVLTAGLLLVHYYTAVLFAIFLVVLGVQLFFRDVRRGRIVEEPTSSAVRQSQAQRGGSWLLLAAAALLGFGLAGTWVARTWVFTQGRVALGAISPTIDAVEAFYFPNYLSYLWRLLGPARNQILTLTALFGIPILFRRSATRAFGFWSVMLGVFTLPWGIYLTPFRPDHAAIVLFLPVCILIAGLVFSLAEWRRDTRFGRWKAAILTILVAGLAGLGAWQTSRIINPSTVLGTQADLEAMDWIERSTSPEARFFINVTPWQFGSYRGTDGGWWITPLTGRGTLLPPALYTMGAAGYAEHLNGLASTASGLEECSPDFWELVRSAGLTYVYVNETRGSLRPAGLQTCPGVELVYSSEGVFIYQIRD